MANRWLRSMLVFALTLALSGQAFAQDRSGQNQAQGSESERLPTGPRKQLATIIFAGLGGAVLGLSTLSFYGRPQDKLNNIAIGFAIGVISGTALVTYKAATNPAEFYGTGARNDRPWSEIENAQPSLAARDAAGSVPLTFSYAFEF